MNKIQYTVCYFTNDIELSMRIIKLCNKLKLQIAFPDADNIQEIKNIQSGIVIIDLDDPHEKSIKLGEEVKALTDMTLIGIMKPYRKQIKKLVEKSGFDIVLPKSLLEHNLSTIIHQTMGNA